MLLSSGAPAPTDRLTVFHTIMHVSCVMCHSVPLTAQQIAHYTNSAFNKTNTNILLDSNN